ncbi:MAG: hypothetical protein AAGA38_16970 [Pseudomonadota bacterium]
MAAFSAYQGRVVEAPEMTFLALQTVQHQGGEQYAVYMHNLLPDGGIDGKHLCGLFTLDFFGSGRPNPPDVGEIRLASALLLRTGVDYEAAYPDAFPIAQRRGQFVTLPRQDVWIGLLPDGLTTSEESEIVEDRISEHSSCARSIQIKAGRAVLIPTC